MEDIYFANRDKLKAIGTHVHCSDYMLRQWFFFRCFIRPTMTNRISFNDLTWHVLCEA